MKSTLVQKVSFSLSPFSVAVIGRAARDLADGNASMIVDVAVKCFARLDETEQQSFITRELAKRAAITREGWQHMFWQRLGAMFDVNDQVGNPYAPRRYGDFLVAFLTKSLSEFPNEDDDFNIHATEVEDLMHNRKTWPFPRTESPIDVAETVGQWIRERTLFPFVDSSAATRIS
ncbi:MAG TPA: hypothetical protein VGZ00_03080 [Candidatus Baltobacteraceae bacterium]|jgi:hypothetical protein|nr:hypothetical protein [Candidatus Baltobacteraceae bacterium]